MGLGVGSLADRQTIEELYAKALKLGKLRKLGEEAYDFAGWCALRWIEDKAQHQTISQSYVDYLRETRGRYLTGGDALLQKHKGELRAHPDETDEEALGRFLEQAREFIEEFSPRGLNLSDVDLTGCMSPRQREAFSLFVRGTDHQIIAKKLGVHYTTVSVIKEQVIRAARRSFVRHFVDAWWESDVDDESCTHISAPGGIAFIGTSGNG